MHPGKLPIYILLSGTLISQSLLFSGYLISGLSVFSLLILYVFFKHSEDQYWHLVTRFPRSKWLMLSIWIIELVIRCWRINVTHPIDGISSRFGYVAASATKGIYFFPFIPSFEFDETLSAYFIAPFIIIFGKSWVSFKLASIILSSLIIPAVFLFTESAGGTPAAVSAAFLVTFSRYFQKCDPLMSMVRFSMITTILFMSLWLCMKRKNIHSLRMGFILGVLSSLACYAHSQGRIVVPIILICFFMQYLKINYNLERKSILRTLCVYFVTVIIFIAPLLYIVSQNPGYIYYKKRQIFGFHEQFPFSWQGLLLNLGTLLVTFNYRAFLQVHFKESSPLLNFEMAWGILGGILLICFKRNWTLKIKTLIVSLCLTLFPLMFVTPGNWRGMYMTPVVGNLAVLAGLWFGFISSEIFRNKRMIITCVIIIFTIIGYIRTQYFFSKSKNLYDQVTLLFDDLVSEKDIPHLFADSLDQCNPGIPIFEFSKGIFFKEYKVFRAHPLRVVYDYAFEEELHSYLQHHAGKAVLIVSPKEKDVIMEIEQEFPSHSTRMLMYSRLLAMTVFEKTLNEKKES